MAQQTTLPPVTTENVTSPVELNLLPPAGLDESIWRSLAENVRGWLHPEKLPPLQLTSKPIEDNGILPRTDVDGSLWSSLRQNVRDFVSPEKLPPLQLTSKPIEDNGLLPPTDAERSLFSSLRENIKSTFFPEKLPPLQVSSKPIKVRNIWGAYDYKQEGAGVSLMVHAVLIAGRK